MSESFDIQRIRSQFPILAQTENGHPLIYLDSGATTQKPQSVIDAVAQYYRHDNANVHRGVYALSERATEAYEGVRDRVVDFVHASSRKEVVFVRGATEAINLVAQSYGRAFLQAGDEVLITELEHHSNIVPWQFLRDQIGIKLVVVPINERGEVPLADYEAALSERTKLVAISHMSNALGTINDVAAMTRLAKQKGAQVLVDGAQAIAHLPVDVQAIGCDFYVFSGHKMYGPTGVGVLWAREALLDRMPPYQGGGDMIHTVTFEKTEYNELPYKFEAGTPNIAGVVGLGAAIAFVESLEREAIEAYEQRLLSYATQQLQRLPGLVIIGQAQHKAAVISFVIEGAHPHDLATLMDQDGVAVRASHHCAQPVMQKFQVPATVRASFGVYNSFEDVDRLVASVQEAVDMLL
ncbi:aminotransferase class V-fold PLP-dependent enzyme [Thiomicrospira sp. WB1]|uniref:aminotransferase class V-fold PLP-dependent enzyme n=1 Tax=Thiomicrospira sp. WB1 TaxID=1685380 RepID=UPI00074A374E|nr:cysteine desulfurase [Thiomicrospira sp. WB1]KUJ71400.1 cysteine sulfinate desulfinase [Thiomicrospira sp. WB1]